MSTDTNLRSRLHDLAEDAPQAGRSGEDLWRAGVRRQRLRRAAIVAGAAVAVAVVVGLTSALRVPTGQGPVERPAERGLPSVVEAPDPWSQPVADPGPVSAISMAFRNTREGMTGIDQRSAIFGVSAVDGVARFLDVPVRPMNVDDSNFALSPDGTLVAMSRYMAESSSEDGNARLLGWDVLDTRSGKLTRLRPPGMPETGFIWRDLAFTADSRFLVTDFSLSGERANDASSLVAWELATGDQVVVEAAGHYWEPGRGSGPDGVVWTRQRTVHTVDPDTGDHVETSLPHQLVDASFSPDGTTLAYIGHEGDRPNSRGPWHLFVRESDHSPRQIDVDISPGQILGWRDETHVVVSHYGPQEARTVDVETGEWQPLPLETHNQLLMMPEYATALLPLSLAAGVEQPDAGDPRPWMHQEVQWIGIGLLFGGVLQVWLVLRRRRGRA